MNKTFIILAVAAAGGIAPSHAETSKGDPSNVHLSTPTSSGDVSFSTMTFDRLPFDTRTSTPTKDGAMLRGGEKAIAVSSAAAPSTGK